MTSVTVAPPATSTSTAELRRRVCAAVVSCVARLGLRSTTVDHIAVEAGCGRATIYRVIPGGRAGLLAATIDHGIGSVLAAADDAIAGSTSFADAVARAINAAACSLAGFEAFQRVLREEPGAVLPFISFERLAPLLARASVWSVVAFAPFAPAESAAVAGDWSARVVLDHLRLPGSPIDLTELDHCHRLVNAFLIPVPSN